MDSIGLGQVEGRPWDMGLSLLKLRGSHEYGLISHLTTLLYIAVITTIISVVSNVPCYVQFKFSQLYAKATENYFRKKN